MKTLKTFAGASALALLLLHVGCATMSVDKNRLANVRKVAIVGFVVQQEMPEGLEWNLTGGSKKGMGFEYGKSLPSPAKHATDMYFALMKTLHDRFHWTIADQTFIAKNPTYAQLFDKNMTGLQSRPPVGARIESYGAKGILDSWPVERMGDGERKALMKTLGVDAIAVATVKIELEKAGGLKKLIGAGDFKPKATLQFALYDGSSDQPVWKDIWSKGQPTEKGSAHVFGITNIEALNQLAVTAATNSYQQLLARYDEQKS
jgi:hypothetical protein